jgi:hypothetical protein
MNEMLNEHIEDLRHSATKMNEKLAVAIANTMQ